MKQEDNLKTEIKTCPCLVSLCRDRDILVPNADTTKCFDGNYTQCLNYIMSERRMEGELSGLAGAYRFKK